MRCWICSFNRVSGFLKRIIFGFVNYTTEEKICSTCEDVLGSNSLCVECISCNPQQDGNCTKDEEVKE